MARTPKLNDMQLILLATACQREDGSLLPPPDSLGAQGARIRKAVEGLIKRNLAEEAEVVDAARSWREEEDRKLGVIITAAGRAIIAAEEQEIDAGAGGQQAQADAEPEPAAPAEPAVEPVPAAPATDTRPGTKQSMLIDLLRREGGASLDDLVAATGWLPHTARAALTGLRKKGHGVQRTSEAGVSRYTIAAAA